MVFELVRVFNLLVDAHRPLTGENELLFILSCNACAAPATYDAQLGTKGRSVGVLVDHPLKVLRETDIL